MSYRNVAMATIINSLHVDRLTFVNVGVTAVFNKVFLINPFCRAVATYTFGELKIYTCASTKEVKFSLCMFRRCISIVGVQFCSFLTWVLDSGKSLAYFSGWFTPYDEIPGTIE